jgi:hypothetical protein
MPQVWGMLRDPDELLACVRAGLTEGRVSVLLPWPPAAVLVLGPLTREISPYPFLDLPRHLILLGLDRRTALRFAHGIARGWCLICLERQNAQSAGRPLPLRHPAAYP